MTNNELWKLEPGFIAAYTEDKELMRKVNRNKTSSGWLLMAEYHDLKTESNKLFAKQYKLPHWQKRHAERMFNTKVKKL